MFLETALALVVLGLVSGIVFTFLVAVLPLERHIRDMRRDEIRAMRERREAHQAGTYRAQLHKGTPYIPPKPAPLELLLADIADPNLEQRIMDDHNGSRKALEVVQ